MRILILIIFIFYSLSDYSQGFKVKDFQKNINDGSAFHAPLDAEGHPCGLIKVRTDNSELKFKGNIVGEVENKMNEYWVYMSKGSKSVNILHPHFLPLHIDFDTYGIGEVSSKATYMLTLNEQKYNKEKSGIVATLKPETAALYIDDVFIENLSGHGLYQLYLPKGNHVCRIEQKGYRPNIQAVTTGKGIQSLNVELESLMAELEVKSKTGTAEIYIDGELKGNGTWKGALLAGEHQIEARQQNFESYTQSVSLTEKESRSLAIPLLKRSMGKVNIKTVPSNLPIIIDGKTIGVSPCTAEMETGKHYVSCSSYGLVPYRGNIEVNSGDVKFVTLTMVFDNNNWQKETYMKAYRGNMEAIKVLSETIIGWIYRGSSKDPIKDSQECIFWMERYSHPEDLLDFEGWISAYCYAGKPEKALELYYPIKTKIENRGGMFLDESYMSEIGDAFLKKKDPDKAIQCYEKAGKNGYEGLGDCYAAKGNKQLAGNYYRKCLSLDYYDNKNRVEKKLKELNM